MAVQIFLMNLVVILLAWISIRWIGESPDWEGLCLFHLARFLCSWRSEASAWGFQLS